MAVKKDAKFYQRQMKLADQAERQYRTTGKKVNKVYRWGSSEHEEKGPSRFNILWANTQVQLPALYSQQPKPDIRRRWKGPSKEGREIATAVERALSFSMDAYDFDRMAEKLILDLLLPGRMVSRVRYHPVIETMEEEMAVEPGTEGAEEQEDGTFLLKKQFDQVVHEEVRAYHVPWDKYRQTPADCWNDVWWVAYGDNFLTLDEIKEQFGEEFDDVPLMYSDNDSKDESKEDEGEIRRAQVWELWDKEDKQVVAFIMGYDTLLMKQDDPLRLSGFFPQPEPAQLIETPNSMIPVPEYSMYQFQAEELNNITKRIAALTDALQAKGFYPGEEAKKMNELAQSGDNILVPVDNYAMLAEKGGLKGMIDWFPIKDIVEVWQRLIVRREDLTQSIFELIGISDIQRGATDPRETRGAQQLKANFGGRRLLPKKNRVERFFRDILRIKAEIISENFNPTTLKFMTGTEITPEMRAIMRSDALRSFSIDVETDSTVAPDDAQEKQGVAEFMNALSSFLSQAAPIIQAEPSAAEPLGKMLLWMSRKFKIARDVEQEIEDFIASFQKQQDQSSQVEDAQAKAAQMEAQIEQFKAELESKIKSEESQAEIQRKDRESQAEIARKDREANAKLFREGRATATKMEQQQTQETPTTEAPSGPKSIRLVRENGQVVGGEVSEGDGKVRKITLIREEGKLVGGEISA